MEEVGNERKILFGGKVACKEGERPNCISTEEIPIGIFDLVVVASIKSLRRVL